MDVLEHELSLGQYRMALREYIVGACDANPCRGHVKVSKTLPMTTYYRSDGYVTQTSFVFTFAVVCAES